MNTPDRNITPSTPQFSCDDLYEARIAQKELKKLNQLRLFTKIYPFLTLISCVVSAPHVMQPHSGSPIENFLLQALIFAPTLYILVSWMDAVDRLQKKKSDGSLEPMALISGLMSILLNPAGKIIANMHQTPQTPAFLAADVFAAAILLALFAMILRKLGILLQIHMTERARQEKRGFVISDADMDTRE
ncbi:hypothetical protein CCAX7_22820 [Capsulimonas corticalis]|uniref:Uncharacterized protein n=1 Tax=Capsulimonas corticalis TaxID=2219043 RepID=A0A402CUX4_9BACT|nr:hypothetical protein [Capsulimonas corticalis]BDI30231.1 hypothetical protein CCAX7_22820 [Capsulimonas corticalis]